MSIQVFLYENPFENDLINLPLTESSLGPATQSYISRSFFLRRTVGISRHPAESPTLNQEHCFLALWDKDLIHGLRGMLLSPVLIMKINKETNTPMNMSALDIDAAHFIVEVVHMELPGGEPSDHRWVDRLVNGFYLLQGHASGIEGCHVRQQFNGNLTITNLLDFFRSEQNIMSSVQRVDIVTHHIVVVCFLDRQMHNNGDNSPYLFLILDDNYRAMDVSSDDLPAIAEAFFRIKQRKGRDEA